MSSSADVASMMAARRKSGLTPTHSKDDIRFGGGHDHVNQVTEEGLPAIGGHLKS